MKRKFKKLGYSIIFIAIVALVVGVVMLLWNALIPSIIGWNSINYWQAAGLLLLSKLLFGGFGRHFHGRGFGRHGKKCGRGRHNKQEFRQMHDKMKGMSREERREFIRERMKKSFAKDESSSENTEN